MTDQIVPINDTHYIELMRGGQPIDLNQYPSLLALVHARQRALDAIDTEIADLEQRISEREEDVELREDMGMATQGLKGTITRWRNRIAALEDEQAAHEANYLQIPADREARRIALDYDDDMRWAISLPSDVPLDVMRALHHAYNQCLFDSFVLYLPRARGRGSDPIIAGIAGGAHFYIASWR